MHISCFEAENKGTEEFLVQDGIVEGHVLIPCYESTKITTGYWIAISRMLEPTKKRYPCPKTKKKPEQDGRRDTITIKSNPIPTRWLTHKLENNNIKEVLPLLWRLGIPHQASHLGTDKGTGNPQRIWPWRPVGFDYKTSTGLGETETPVLEGTNKPLPAPRLRGKEQWLHRKLNQNHLLVLESLLWRPWEWRHWQQSWKDPLA